MNTRLAFASGLAALATAAAPSLLAQSSQDAASDFYGSYADHILLGRHALERRVHDRAGFVAGDRGASLGYLFSDVSTPDDFDLARHDLVLGFELPLERGLTLGLLLSGGSGETDFPGASADTDGVQGLFYATKSFGEKWLGYATLGYGAQDFDARRTTLLGTALGSTDARAYGASIGARYLVHRTDTLEVTVRGGLRHDSATVDGFTERGAPDAQRVDDLDLRRLSVELGGSALRRFTAAGRPLDLEVTASIDAPVVDERDDVRSVFIATSTPYTNSYEDAEISASLGLNIAYHLRPASRLFAGIEGRVGGHEGVTAHVGARLSF